MNIMEYMMKYNEIYEWNVMKYMNEYNGIYDEI